MPDSPGKRWCQSAPAIAGGRIAGLGRCLIKGKLFQSAPAIAGGRIADASCGRHVQRRFNPRPPLLAGESPLRKAIASASFVSIRARHCWRANRFESCRCRQRGLFQSAPAIAGGRIYAPKDGANRTGCFNPRPPLLAGESLRVLRFATEPRCFNPRPPLLAGESLACRTAPGALRCFNPRPPLLAGESRVLPARGLSSGQFQSAPAIAGGRIPAAHRCRCAG